MPALQDGAVSLLVRQMDVAGNISATTSLNFTIDKIALAPSVSLKTDTGTAGDKITTDGTLNIAGTEAGAKVQFNVVDPSNDSAWSDAFTAVTGANQVWVRQIDVTGNTSPASSVFSFTVTKPVVVDSTPEPTPLSATLLSDTGASATDKITTVATVNISLGDAAKGSSYS